MGDDVDVEALRAEQREARAHRVAMADGLARARGRGDEASVGRWRAKMDAAHDWVADVAIRLEAAEDSLPAALARYREMHEAQVLTIKQYRAENAALRARLDALCDTSEPTEPDPGPTWHLDQPRWGSVARRLHNRRTR